jgi:hypothetical protein
MTAKKNGGKAESAAAAKRWTAEEILELVRHDREDNPYTNLDAFESELEDHTTRFGEFWNDLLRALLGLTSAEAGLPRATTPTSGGSATPAGQAAAAGAGAAAPGPAPGEAPVPTGRRR